MNFTDQAIKTETQRLFKNLEKVGWSKDECELYAHITLEINKLKKEKNAIILAHSYQTPDIIYGVADFVGDSYGLSIKASKTDADIIVFCSVYFMAETAKILNPQKQVLVPNIAGCSLADSITKEDVLNLKKKHPNTLVLCYVNTTAEVKSVSDICVTSSNALSIINSLPDKKIIFIPDKYMAANLQKLTDKEIISWDGKCIVHEEFSVDTVKNIRGIYPKAKILAHTECTPEVISEVDLAGGTKDMINYIETNQSDEYMLVTECGLVDRMKVEFPTKSFIGSCSLCPYMKKIELKNILQVLKNPREEQIIKIDKNISEKAKKTLNRMLNL
jgi:quinolinate synthase